MILSGHRRSSSRPLVLLVIAGLSGALALTGCGRRGDAPVHSLRDANGGKKYGGTFNMNETGDLRSLDPPQINDATSHHIAENIYDQLLSFDEKLNLIPSLASLPAISEDGLTYTYRIRSDVYFHDNPCFPDGKGRKMTAKDIVYCWSRALDPSTNTLALPYFQVIKGAKEYFNSGAKLAQGVAGLQAPDDTTFVVTLEKPFSPFINYAAVGNAFIYPKEAIEKYGKDYPYNPVGTGPFRFGNYAEAQHCILVRNPNYWAKDEHGNQLPFLDTVRFTFNKDNKAEVLLFKQSRLDHVYRIPSEFFQDIVGEDKKAKGEYAKYQLVRVPALSTQFYGFNTQKATVSNRHLRRAFAFAVDRERIIKYVLKGQAYAAAHHGIVPPSMPNYPWESVQGIAYNPDSARAELELAKKELGGTIPQLTLQLNSGGGRNEEVAQAIQRQLTENLGVNIQLQLVEWAQHTARIDEGKAEFYRLGWIADYSDPQNFLNLLYGKNIPASGPSSINSTRYNNPAFDAAYEAAIAENDPVKRGGLWARCAELAAQDAPILTIYHDEDYHMWQPYVQGYPVNAMDRRPMKTTWFSE